MKKSMKLASLLLAVLLALSCMSVVAFAEGASIAVTLRVEGIDGCLYTGSYTYENAPKSIHLDKLLLAYDAADDGISFVGIEDNYITEINGLKAGKYGGWDGWMFQINGVDSAVGVKDALVRNGDAIVYYYGDPFGVGMQFPKLDDSQKADGKLVFYSEDSVYDPVTWEPTLVKNAVKDMDVTLKGANFTLTAKTDADGVASFDPADIVSGEYTVSVSRYAENGCPTVLRFAEGEVTVELTGTACKYCGHTHEGAGKVVEFFHSIFYFFAKLFGKMK